MIDKFKNGPAVLPGAVLPFLNRGFVADSLVGCGPDTYTPFVIALALLANVAQAVQRSPGNGPVGPVGRPLPAAVETGVEVRPKSANSLETGGDRQADRLSGQASHAQISGYFRPSSKPDTLPRMLPENSMAASQ